MSPNLESHITTRNKPTNGDIPLILTPLTEVDILFEENNHLEEHVEFIPDLIVPNDINYIPLEQNLRGLLIRVTNTEDLITVTQVKLRVISREITLQRLSFYVPNLRELILDGSAVESLRDIGNGLKNLKILKVNQCGLTCIDGVFSFENLEQLYAADNQITSVAQCAFLTKLRILNLRRNLLTDSSLKHLTLCLTLEEIYLEGNVCVVDYSELKKLLQRKMKKLKILDEDIKETDRHGGEGTENSEVVNETTANSFTITFPPRICF